VPVRLNASSHNTVTGVQMSHVRRVFATVPQGGSGTVRPGLGDNVGRAVGVMYGGIQQGGSMG
jgi:hypothetical protein